MKFEHFDSIREFNNKFPSKFYICAFCGKITTNQKYCIHCTTRADGFLKTMNCGYKYQIQGQEQQEIFKPIELLEGENNDKQNDSSTK